MAESPEANGPRLPTVTMSHPSHSTKIHTVTSTEDGSLSIIWFGEPKLSRVGIKIVSRKAARFIKIKD